MVWGGGRGLSRGDLQANQFMQSSRQKYQTYLQTDHWRELRLLKLEMVGNKCEKCPCRQRLQVHHLRYDPYRESLNDLQVLCENCHENAHYNEKRGGRQEPAHEEKFSPPSYKPLKNLSKKQNIANALYLACLQGNAGKSEESLSKNLFLYTDRQLGVLASNSPSGKIRAIAAQELKRRDEKYTS